MSIPVDDKLYNEAKKKVDSIYDKPSAYRSMAYTRFYLRAFREKYGDKKQAYKGKKPGDLEKWRREKWIDIRSFLDTPEDPKPCGGIEYGKKEYPLCMPERKAKRYSKAELSALLYRKSELGKTRLVKEPFLRDLYGEPIKEVSVKEIKPLEPLKQIKEKKVTEKSNIKTVTRKLEKGEVKPEREQTKIEEKIQIEKRPIGRPKKEKTAEQIGLLERREQRRQAREQRQSMPVEPKQTRAKKEQFTLKPEGVNQQGEFLIGFN